MVRPAGGAPASGPVSSGSHELFGCDQTTGIVSVDADSAGRARVWRRIDDRVALEQHRFPNWFLATSLDLLAHLPAHRLSSDWLRSSHGALDVHITDPLSVVELDRHEASDDDDAYRYLVLTSKLDEVQTTLVENANKRDGGEAQTLGDLRGLVLIFPPVEQFLTLTGRTYFKGMSFDAMRRMQFDLETTGLNEDRDRIFMVSMRDSTGWRDSLDTAEMTESQLLAQFVQNVQARDPDALENHNIFGFDLSFLVKRAARLGVRLALGRDGSEPWLETDVFDSGERAEPFLRWRVAGREVIDTQHAVRRFGVAAPDMRRHGLKDAARYFGFARGDREYVPGAEVWPTYRTDPDRIRRYAADDVDEVDGLSRRLMPAAFGLASMLPRAYERIAADSGAGSLWELLLVRAYLHEGHAIGAPTPRMQRPSLGPRSELLIKGVIGPAVRAVVNPLLPRVLASQSIAAANDDLRVMPRLVGRLLDEPPDPGESPDPSARPDPGEPPDPSARPDPGEPPDPSARLLASAAHPYLAGQGLFSDPRAATDAMAVARRYLNGVLEDLRRRGCGVVEIEGEQVVFGVPSDWTPFTEQQVAAAAEAFLPPGVGLSYLAHYAALYARGPGTSMTLGGDGAVTLIGPAFRAGRLERFGESYLQRAAKCALRGDVVGLRQVFLETVHLLRTRQIPLEELCVHVTLHKSLAQYRRGGTHEEPYEVLLAAGIRSWRVGQRIRYFRARGGEPRLLQEGDGLTAAEADVDYYVQRLVALYCEQFAQAFRREDFLKIFRLPADEGPFGAAALAAEAAELGAIRPIAVPVVAD